MTEKKIVWCYNEEFKCYMDDCGSVGCTLTKHTWNEWAGEDDCQECMFARDPEDYDEDES